MSNSAAPSIVWFRDDLRLADHTALTAAAKTPILCVFIFDEESEGVRPLGGAARWWLHHSLASLSAALETCGSRLDILRGRADERLVELAVAAGAHSAHWLRRYGAAERALDQRVDQALRARGVVSHAFEGALLHDPERVKTGSGSPYRVFTPFWRALRQRAEPPSPLPAPRRLSPADWPPAGPQRVALDQLALLPRHPDWAGGLRETWSPGEDSARARLAAFIDSALDRYASHRDVPAAQATSMLSPHLRFGEISARQVWHAIRHAGEQSPAFGQGSEKFLSELAWREFSYHLLFHFPELARRNFNPRFDGFRWRRPASAEIDAWRAGRTGYPIVDAGMRELWRTGYMHNRVRLIAASFLIKDLLIDWRIGEQWFWDTLCDADPANNAASWQWAAGSGADAAPYFRVFNPVKQGQKFDPDGAYVRRYVPELAATPAEWIHDPWNHPPARLGEAAARSGEPYPAPVVDHAAARDRALATFRALSEDPAPIRPAGSGRPPPR